MIEEHDLLLREEKMIDVRDHLQEEMTGSWQRLVMRNRIVMLSCLGGDLDLRLIETVLLLERDHLCEDLHRETFEIVREVLRREEMIEVLIRRIGDAEVLLLL